MRAHSTFFTLIERAVRLTALRFPLYFAALSVAIGAQWAVVLLNVPNPVVIGGSIFPPILTALVYAFVENDTREEAAPSPAVWERILERSWAVIVIDFAISYVSGVGQGGMQGDSLASTLIGAATLLLSATLIFADASATVDDGIPFWMLLPAAFQRSILASWSGPTFVRAVAITATWLMINELSLLLAGALQQAHVTNAEFWGLVPINAFVTPPLAALTLLVYRDAKPVSEPE